MKDIEFIEVLGRRIEGPLATVVLIAVILLIFCGGLVAGLML